jgi:hypothetical protein
MISRAADHGTSSYGVIRSMVPSRIDSNKYHHVILRLDHICFVQLTDARRSNSHVNPKPFVANFLRTLVEVDTATASVASFGFADDTPRYILLKSEWHHSPASRHILEKTPSNLHFETKPWSDPETQSR